MTENIDFDRFGELAGTSGAGSGFREPGKDCKTKENRGSKGWLGEVPGASTDSDLVQRGAALRKILSRVSWGRPTTRKRVSFNTHSPKPSAMLHALTRPGPEGPASFPENFATKPSSKNLTSKVLRTLVWVLRTLVWF